MTFEVVRGTALNLISNSFQISFQYPGAVDELMKLTQLFVTQTETSSEEELAEIRQFRTSTLQLYLSILDGRTSWATLISCLKILIETTEDKLFTVCNNGNLSIKLLKGFFPTTDLKFYQCWKFM